MTHLLQNFIRPLTPEMLAAFEARGFDAEQFLGFNLGVGEHSERPGRIAVP